MFESSFRAQSDRISVSREMVFISLIVEMFKKIIQLFDYVLRQALHLLRADASPLFELKLNITLHAFRVNYDQLGSNYRAHSVIMFDIWV